MSWPEHTTPGPGIWTGGEDEPQAELGIRRGGRRTFRDFMQGQPVSPLDPAELDRPATRADAADCAHELARIAALLDELVQVDSGEVIVARKRLVLNAARPFDTFIVEAPDAFQSVKVDNPTAAVVDVLYSASQPSALNSDERVPAHMGRILTAPFDEIAVGFDPAVVPAGDSVIRCTFYSRPYPPTSYAFV